MRNSYKNDKKHKREVSYIVPHQEKQNIYD